MDPDYSISYVSGVLNVTPVALTITADNQTKVYGADLPTLTASYSGFVNGDKPANLHIQPTLSTTAAASSDTGAYAITASGALDPDYTISYVGGILTVSRATLTVVADSLTRPQGTANPSLTYSLSGLVNGDPTSVVSGAPILSTTATIASFDGQYPITVAVGTFSAANYDFTTVDGILIVTASDTTIALTASPGSTSTYGQDVSVTAVVAPTTTGPTPTGTVHLQVDGSFFGSAVTLVNGSATIDLLTKLQVGTHTITAIYSGDDTYATNSQAVTQTVIPAMLTITADNQTKVYGAAVPTLTASYTGFVNGDTSASLTTQPTLSTTATVNSKVPGNPFAITASGAVDSDYTISYAAGILTVTPAPLTITADNQTKVYGAALPTLTVSYSGFVNGDDANNLSTQPTLTTTATARSHVGSYDITASGAVDPDYTISYAGGTLTVSPATLTVVADSLTRPEGDANPPLTYSLSGLVNGDTTSVVSGAPILSTTATIASFDGQYPITVAVGTLRAANYDFTTVDGNLIVTETSDTTIALTANPGSTSTYGQALTFTATLIPFDSAAVPPTGTVQFEVDGIPIGSAVTVVNDTATSDSVSSLHAGGHTIEAMYSGDSLYDPKNQSVTQTVTPAMLTITAGNQTKVYGAALPTLTASYTGFVNGDTALTTQPTLSTTATAHSDTGGYAITASGGGGFRLHDHVCCGEPHGHHRAADDHRRQPDQGVRRGGADPDGQLLRVRRRRHCGQPEHPAHADDDGYRRQPRRLLHHHRQRRGGLGLQHQLCARDLDGHRGGADDHRRQHGQDLRTDGDLRRHRVLRDRIAH